MRSPVGRGLPKLPLSYRSTRAQNIANARVEMDRMEQQEAALDATEREFLPPNHVGGKTPRPSKEDDNDTTSSEDEDGMEVGERRTTTTVTPRTRTPTPVNARGGTATPADEYAGPFSGLPKSSHVSPTTGASTRELTLGCDPRNISEEIAARVLAETYHTLTLKMTTYCLKAFPTYKALVGRHATLNGVFMQEFIELVRPHIQVSPMSEQDFILTKTTRQDDWKSDDDMVKRLIQFATTCINKKRSFVVDELKKRALGT
jgi:hypothetical protein